MECLDLNNRQIQLTIVLKLQQLQREQLPGLVYKNLEDFLTKSVWRKNYPLSLHEAVNDVLSLSADQVVRFLSKQAIIEGNKRDLNEFQDLLGGDRG